MDESSTHGMSVPFVAPKGDASPAANESSHAIWHEALPIAELETVIEHAAKTAETLLDVAIATIHFHPETETALRSLSQPPLRSLCASLVASEYFVQIPDTMDDPRYCSEPLVVGDPGVRFIACAPLPSARGPSLGALCLADLEPRSLTASDQAKLSDLARVTARQLDELLNRDADSDRLPRDAEPEQSSFMIGSRDPERPVTVARLRWLDDGGNGADQARRAVIEEVLNLVEVGETVRHLAGGELLLIIPEDEPTLLRIRLEQFLESIRTAGHVMKVRHPLEPTLEARVLSPEQRRDQRILLALEADWSNRRRPAPWTLSLETLDGAALGMTS